MTASVICATRSSPKHHALYHIGTFGTVSATVAAVPFLICHSIRGRPSTCPPLSFRQFPIRTDGPARATSLETAQQLQVLLPPAANSASGSMINRSQATRASLVRSRRRTVFVPVIVAARRPGDSTITAEIRHALLPLRPARIPVNPRCSVQYAGPGTECCIVATTALLVSTEIGTLMRLDTASNGKSLVSLSLVLTGWCPGC